MNNQLEKQTHQKTSQRFPSLGPAFSFFWGATRRKEGPSLVSGILPLRDLVRQAKNVVSKLHEVLAVGGSMQRTDGWEEQNVFSCQNHFSGTAKGKICTYYQQNLMAADSRRLFFPLVCFHEEVWYLWIVGKKWKNSWSMFLPKESLSTTRFRHLVPAEVAEKLGAEAAYEEAAASELCLRLGFWFGSEAIRWVGCGFLVPEDFGFLGLGWKIYSHLPKRVSQDVAWNASVTWYFQISTHTCAAHVLSRPTQAESSAKFKQEEKRWVWWPKGFEARDMSILRCFGAVLKMVYHLKRSTDLGFSGWHAWDRFGPPTVAVRRFGGHSGLGPFGCTGSCFDTCLWLFYKDLGWTQYPFGLWVEWKARSCQERTRGLGCFSMESPFWWRVFVHMQKPFVKPMNPWVSWFLYTADIERQVPFNQMRLSWMIPNRQTGGTGGSWVSYGVQESYESPKAKRVAVGCWSRWELLEWLLVDVKSGCFASRHEGVLYPTFLDVSCIQEKKIGRLGRQTSINWRVLWKDTVASQMLFAVPNTMMVKRLVGSLLGSFFCQLKEFSS